MTPCQEALYAEVVAKGGGHRLAEMLALGVPPGANTDREFLEGRENGRQFQDAPGLGDFYRRVAEGQGQSVKGKVYLSGLAAYPGDPRAWVSGRGDAQRVLEERGWGAEGAVNTKVTRVAETTGGGIAKDIVDAEVASMREALPPGEKFDAEGAREAVIDARAPHWAKKEVP